MQIIEKKSKGLKTKTAAMNPDSKVKTIEMVDEDSDGALKVEKKPKPEKAEWVSPTLKYLLVRITET